MTWEPEENVPAAVYLPEFKKVNNLPQSLIRLRLNIASDRNAYVKPNVLKEVQERCAKVTNEHMNTFTVTLNDEVNNGKFGIIPLPLYKRKLIRGEEYLKKGDEMYWLKQVVVESPNATTSAKFVENHEKIDRSFLQMMIRNDNIVCIRDGYITSENERKATISFVHDWCHQTLREKMIQEGKVDWKNVCKDILKALSYIHTNGIHQAVSIDSIYYNTDGNYQLSNFKNFTFTQQLQHNEVKSEGIELAPRKYGLSAPFDATLDLYALAIVLLQCQKKSLLFRRKPNSVIEIEEDIEKAMNNLETDEERRFIRMMLRARMHMHNVLAVYRYTADGFLEHPLLSTEKMKSVECLYVHHMLGIPVVSYFIFTVAIGIFKKF
uniref:Protein kinase domain-containing protein n=1 Tax=Caenorhabditis japonica TaxID=281687 RepID=A0A8R1HP12_CAEJA